jgi:hypothetical protein
MMYGTAWKKDRTAGLVYEAIKAGFRGIDTAAMKKHYDEAGTGEGIRRAIREGIVSRKDLFVSILTSSHHLLMFNSSEQIQTKFTPLDSTSPYSMSDPIPAQIRMYPSRISPLLNHLVSIPPLLSPPQPKKPPPQTYP